MDVPDVGIDVPEISQVALVVEDLEDAMERYRRILGIEPWEVYYIGPPEQEEATYYGEPTEAAFEIGYAYLGDLEIEIIEPLEGDSVHRDFLEEHGEGIHHLACFAFDDVIDVVESFENAGIPVVQSGKWHDTHYIYFDTRDRLNGVYFETLAGGEYDPGPKYVYPPDSEEGQSGQN
ncbi:VOC family protein [Halopenitus sp. POP-27]|uniref:VOC family protein n=1 Tax=Halopenitus sp. POP-27 TaxID=2994425 RepID=UPI002468EACD|nr:VOC family protein [Halopenitus sp. POP-27]